MSIRSSIRHARLLAAGVTLSVAATLAIAPSGAAVTYALPGVPTNVNAVGVAGGVVVTWTAPADGNAAISSYSVTGGPGTCAVVVDGSARRAFLPALADQKSANFKVTATNALGNSDPGVAAFAVAPKPGVGARVIGKAGLSLVAGVGTHIHRVAKAVVAAASNRMGNGVWTVDRSGTLASAGAAKAITGSLEGTVAIVPALDDAGVTLVAGNGAFASFGSATLNGAVADGAPVVGAAGTADGKGMWLVRADGEIAAVGTADASLGLEGHFLAATGNTARTGGWALRHNGTVAAFGAAPSLSGSVPNAIGIWHSTGNGVYVLTDNGTVVGLGSATGLGASGIGFPIAIVGATPDVVAKSVTIDEYSDFHGQIEANSTGIGGAAALKAWFDADKAKGATIVAAGGDNFGAAPPVSAQFEELPTVLAENGMGLDVSTLGNHEHDRDQAHLNKMIAASTFKWVASNYSTFDTIKGIAPYVIIERGGVKVGFVGAQNQETAQVATTASVGNIKFLEPVAAVNTAITSARAAGAQIVVVLTHYGFAENVADKATGPLLDIAAGIKGADLIFGAHSHLKFAGRVNGTLVGQTTNAGAIYARNTVCLDAASGAVIGTAGDFVTPTVKSVTPDAALTTLVKGYADQIAGKFDTKIGTMKGVFPFGGTPAIQRQGEVAIGDFIADIVRAKYNTDIVIVNGGGIRANIPALTYKPKATGLSRPATAADAGTYDVLLGDVYTVLPFGNQLATTQVTGAQIWSAMENGVSQYEAVAGRFPQISGFKFTYDVKKPVGSRVVSVTLANGTAIANDASKSYSLTTLDYMITGGDGYTQFNPQKAIIRDLYAQVVADAIIANPNIVIPALDGRITKL